jgi:hypothetical protein
MARLHDLDARLADLERHVVEARPARQPLTVLAGRAPCCDAASAVTGVAEGGCACCSPVE